MRFFHAHFNQETLVFFIFGCLPFFGALIKLKCPFGQVRPQQVRRVRESLQGLGFGYSRATVAHRGVRFRRIP